MYPGGVKEGFTIEGYHDDRPWEVYVLPARETRR
jgi:hypothetical protein